MLFTLGPVKSYDYRQDTESRTLAPGCGVEQSELTPTIFFIFIHVFIKIYESSRRHNEWRLVINKKYKIQIIKNIIYMSLYSRDFKCCPVLCDRGKHIHLFIWTLASVSFFTSVRHDHSHVAALCSFWGSDLYSPKH